MTLPEHTRQPLGPNQERWIQALESGEYKQGTGKLRNIDDEFCCLGVGCEVAGIPGFRTETPPRWMYGGKDEAHTRLNAPLSLVEWLCLYENAGQPGRPLFRSLTELNDAHKSFSEIAAIIRQDPSVYFKEPR